MSDIPYPYMPSDRRLKYVPVDHPFMVEAAKAREECAGDPLYPVGIVLVKDGKVRARAGNGFNRGAGQIHVCPRVVLECPSGTGYELCALHDAPGHAERMLLAEAQRLGIDPALADVYLYGHWWACEPCWSALIAAGIRDLYVTDDAHERFHRDRVYAETLSPSIATVSLEGFEEGMRTQIVDQLHHVGLEVVEGRGDAHCALIDQSAECFLADKLVYTLPYSDALARQIKNVLRQI